jgi:hypothetical protein
MHDTEIAFVKQWWFYKRVKYNRGLIAGGIVAFFNILRFSLHNTAKQ